jgi:hypothetical protein
MPVPNPIETGRRSLVISDDREVSVPVSPDVARAINEVNEKHFEEVRAALEPFGLHPYDIAMPEYRRVVYVD